MPKEEKEEPDLTGDYANVALLLMLYTLQGIPMGLSGSIPMMLSERGVSYTTQSVFSLVSWPFSIKLLWAPIVDALYLERWGRRKSWLVPVQVATGITMLLLSTTVETLLGDADQKKEGAAPVRVNELTAAFFFLFFLMATQDIAVDGWALTMLKKRNIGYQATCNAIGQTFGYFIALTGLLALQSWGIVTLASFMRFWAVVFLVVTAGIVFMKKEAATNYEEGEEEGGAGVLDAYSQMATVISKPAVQKLVVMLFTWKVAFAATDAITHLKLQEYGLPKEHMAYIGTLITPVEIVLPALISKFTSGPKPLSMCLNVYLPRLALGVIVAVLVSQHPFPLAQQDGAPVIPWGYYSLFYAILLAHSAFMTAMFVAQMSFFGSVSQGSEAIGGTYMTLLNTAANLGSKWPATLVLASVDRATAAAGQDGYYILVAACTAVGVVWWVVAREPVKRMEALAKAEWSVAKQRAE